MSVITDRVRQIDAQLDRLTFEDSFTTSLNTRTASDPTITSALESERVSTLIQIIRDLSTGSAASPQLSAWRIEQLIDQSGLCRSPDEVDSSGVQNRYEVEVEWRLVAKAAVQTFGVVMEMLLAENMRLEDDLWYWNEVLSSYRSSSMYMMQTTPSRLWKRARDIWAETSLRLESMDSETLGAQVKNTKASWRQWLAVFRETIREVSLIDLQSRLLTPFGQARAEAKFKRKKLKIARHLTASGLGVLMGEGLNFGPPDELASVSSKEVDWKQAVERSIILIDQILENVSQIDKGVNEFENKIFKRVQETPITVSSMEENNGAVSGPSILAQCLQSILRTKLDNHSESNREIIGKYGKPSFPIRWWLPAGIAIFSSTAILRILTNHRAELITWIRDLGMTTRDFYFNWVVEPITKLIRTIRHDKSEFAIMSRDSLKADLESLERMVVDFARDCPQFATPLGAPAPSSLSAADITDIQAKVSEGDLTPVLRAYEQNIRRPFLGTVRGDLVRACLIQVQQTKVDVKVALSGIDSLLQSQELVFGFVGLTPGILVTAGISRYIADLFSSGGRQLGNSRKGVMILRNIDRILSEAQPTEGDLLPYKEHGMLLCEIHVLRNLVWKTGLLPRGEVLECFLQDVEVLGNGKVAAQKAALERIRWAYGRWFRA